MPVAEATRPLVPLDRGLIVMGYPIDETRRQRNYRGPPFGDGWDSVRSGASLYSAWLATYDNHDEHGHVHGANLGIRAS